MMTGTPPSFSMAGSTSSLPRTNAESGMPMSWRLRFCIDRSLSRLTLMAVAVLRQNTPICSNWRTTAVPKWVMLAPMRGMTASTSPKVLPL